MNIDPKLACNFIFELGQLRRIRHEGWRLAGVDQPETVAAHSLRAAQIAFVLAVLEGHPNPAEVCAIVCFHDMEECRVGDIHRVASRYVTADKVRTAEDQTSPLGEVGQRILELWLQDERRDTEAGVIAKDADYLEMVATAKELLEQGHAAAQDWLDNIRGYLRTESAKELMNSLIEVNSYDWWQGLKKLPER